MRTKKMRTDENAKALGTAIVVVVVIAIILVLAGVLYSWTISLADTSESLSVELYKGGPSSGGTNMNPPNGQPYNDMYFKHYGTNPFISTEDEPISTFSMDVDTGSYTIARSYIRDGNIPPNSAVRVEEFINYFDYDYSSDGNTFTIHTECSRSYFGEDNKNLLKIGIQARRVSPEERKNAVITFVIDVSGSMDLENRLGLVKKSIGILIDNLDDGDKIGLVVYGSSGRKILDPSNEKETIRDAVNNLSPDGSTNAYEGLVLGYEMATDHFEDGKINRVILCSDGVANTGPTSADDILKEVEKQSKEGITLSTLGFGMGNYNDVFMEKLADQGDGNYAYIDTYSEARRIFGEGLVGLLEVVASDAKVQVEFDKMAVDRYRLLGYENRLLNEEDFQDDSVDAGEVGAGHSVTALYELRLNDITGKMAEIRVRYTDPWTDETEEIEISVSSRQNVRPFEDASARFRFTAAVAQFAEILKESYWAKNESLADVLDVSETALTDLKSLDQDTEKDYDFVELVKDAIEIMS